MTARRLRGAGPVELRKAFLAELKECGRLSYGGFTVNMYGEIRERGTCLCPLVAVALHRGAERVEPDDGARAGVLLGLAGGWIDDTICAADGWPHKDPRRGLAFLDRRDLLEALGLEDEKTGEHSRADGVGGPEKGGAI